MVTVTYGVVLLVAGIILWLTFMLGLVLALGARRG